MADVQRISVEEARHRTAQGALLVCAYEDDAKCQSLHLEGSISASELRRQAATLPQTQELIFYCA